LSHDVILNVNLNPVVFETSKKYIQTDLIKSLPSTSEVKEAMVI